MARQPHGGGAALRQAPARRPPMNGRDATPLSVILPVLNEQDNLEILHDFGCTLKAYRRAIMQDLSLYGEMHRFLPVLAQWVGGRVTELEVAHHPRTRGASKYGLLRTYKVLVDLITLKFIGDFQSRPNYVFGGFGLLSLMLGFLSLGVVAYRVFVLRRLEATPLVFLMVIFFLTGVFSLFIGFLAEIVIRGFYDTQRKPTYYVREMIGADPEN